MAAQAIELKKACVIGGSGFLASFLVKLLLQKGYAVNTTVRDPVNPLEKYGAHLVEENGRRLFPFLNVIPMPKELCTSRFSACNQKKISHLWALQSLGDLKVFKADLTDEASFDAPVAGCDIVFHVAAPINFASEDPENDMIKPGIQGVVNVLKACVKARSVKRVIFTSSAAAVTINELKGTGLIMDEGNWTDVEFLTSAKPPTWGYPVSKTLAEKEAWKFAEENKIDLITVIPSLIAGPPLTPNVPSSFNLAMSLITGNEFLINGLKGMQMLSGSISITHVEDVCEAHIFLAEKKSASGRYICCAANTSVPDLAKFLSKRYPDYKIPTEFEGFPSKAKLIISSEKLIKEGFNFKHGIEDIYDDALAYFKAKGLLQH